MFETRGRNTILLHYHYRVDTEFGKCVFAYVAQLDKYWLTNIPWSSQPTYAHVENCYYNKILEYYNDLIIIKLLDNKTPQVEFDNMDAFIISGMPTDKS